ncbi:MAG: GTPase ObgE [Myxococcota bacterium]
MRTGFVDEAVVVAQSGRGGDGIVAWRREKGVPKGGPAGGDGGRGGHVLLVADAGKRSLLDLRARAKVQAQDGQPGAPKNCHGKNGADCLVRVPVGTQVFDAQDDEPIADLTRTGKQAIVCRGGRGGRGNAHFVSATRQAPDKARQGAPGQERRLRLSLKLMADVGLLGFPNAGKSTLLASMSAARPKIADYPFTTLRPQLGVVELEDAHAFVVADIPGLVEGAARGAGLGIRFLKHLERVRVLCHLVEFTMDDSGSEKPGEVVARYQALRNELHQFNPKLCAVPEIVVLSKCDVLGREAPRQSACNAALRAEIPAATPLLAVSAATGAGVGELTRRLGDFIGRATL